MSAHRQQAHLDAPVEEVWSLVGAPDRYPEWWPRVIEVRGERFEEGDEYVQVTRDPTGNSKSNFLIERARDLREIRMSCQLTGTYAHWLLTPAQGGTFVELEMGMEPRRIRYRLLDRAVGRRYFRSWSQQSLDALRNAAHTSAPHRSSESAMSQVNVEIVRRAFDSINRGDVDAALEAAADDFAERLRDDRWRIHWRKHPAARMSMRRGAHHYHLRPYRTEGAQPRCPKP